MGLLCNRPIPKMHPTSPTRLMDDGRIAHLSRWPTWAPRPTEDSHLMEFRPPCICCRCNATIQPNSTWFRAHDGSFCSPHCRDQEPPPYSADEVHAGMGASCTLNRVPRTPDIVLVRICALPSIDHSSSDNPISSCASSPVVTYASSDELARVPRKSTRCSNALKAASVRSP